MRLTMLLRTMAGIFQQPATAFAARVLICVTHGGRRFPTSANEWAIEH